MKNITKKCCPACHLQISASNYLRHTNKCTGQGTWKNQERVRKEYVKTLVYGCKICNKVFNTAQALSGHTQRSHVLLDKQKIYGKKGAAVLAKKVACGEINLSHPHTEAMKNHLSIKACERLSKHSKYSKNTEYAPGIILESSYEIKTAIILDALKIKWIKVRQGYKWDDNGKTRRYVPDFYLPDYDLFLDPKNDYLIKKDKQKIESAMQLNNIKVIVLDKTQITKDFIQNILL
jgi:hypothetical protein